MPQVIGQTESGKILRGNGQHWEWNNIHVVAHTIGCRNMNVIGWLSQCLTVSTELPPVFGMCRTSMPLRDWVTDWPSNRDLLHSSKGIDTEFPPHTSMVIKSNTKHNMKMNLQSFACVPFVLDFVAENHRDKRWHGWVRQVSLRVIFLLEKNVESTLRAVDVQGCLWTELRKRRETLGKFGVQKFLMKIPIFIVLPDISRFRNSRRV